MSTPSGSKPDRAGGLALGIGELSARVERSVHTIRWYEAQGLIPGVQRDGAGRRRYDERHIDWLLLMDRLRGTGMSIAQMRAYTRLVMQGRNTLPERREMLARHGEHVRATIEQWQQALLLIDAKLDFYGEWLASGKRPAQTPSARTVGDAANKLKRQPRKP